MSNAEFRAKLDAVPRTDYVLGGDDTSLSTKFERCVCPECGGTKFEVLYTGPYETSVHCDCGEYFVVHTG